MQLLVIQLKLFHIIYTQDLTTAWYINVTKSSKYWNCLFTIKCTKTYQPNSRSSSQHIKMLSFCHSTTPHSVISSKLFQNNKMFRHFKNRLSGDVASYLKAGKPHTQRCENLRNFVFHAVLKCVTFLFGSDGNHFPIYSAAVRYESQPGNGPSRQMIFLSQSIPINFNTVFPNKQKVKQTHYRHGYALRFTAVWGSDISI